MHLPHQRGHSGRGGRCRRWGPLQAALLACGCEFRDALSKDRLVAASQFVGRRHITNGAVQSDGVVVAYVAAGDAFGICKVERCLGPDAQPGDQPLRRQVGPDRPVMDEINDLVADIVSGPVAVQSRPSFFLGRHAHP